MANILILIAVGAVLALASLCLYLAARWRELRSTSSAWAFSVLLMRLTAFALCIASLIALFNVNVLALVLVFTVWLIDVVGRRRLARESLVWILALTMARKLPLAPSVSAYAIECRGGYRWRVLRFAQRLQAGQTLISALARDRGGFGGLLTTDGAAAVCVGTACGDLPGALREAARISLLRRPFWQETGTRGVYLAQLMGVTLAIMAGFMYFIMPAFIKIFDDFGATLPPATQLLIRVSEAIPSIVGVGLLAVVLLAPLTILLYTITQIDLPGMGVWVRRRHTPALLRALAGVVEREQPLPAALEALAKSYPARPVRRRLRRVVEEISAGAVDWRPLARHGIVVNTDAAVLDAAARVGHLAWALRTLAESQERRQGYRLQVWMQILWPLAILIMGLLVGFIVLAGIMPLAELIEKMV